MTLRAIYNTSQETSRNSSEKHKIFPIKTKKQKIQENLETYMPRKFNKIPTNKKVLIPKKMGLGVKQIP